MVSGCFLYPLKVTCLDNLKCSNIEKTEHVSSVSEAWAKGWSDFRKKNAKVDIKVVAKKLGESWKSLKDSKKVEEEIDEKTTMVHKGISHRSFKRTFTLSDEMKVKGAKMENGMLYIALERIVPDHKKPQTIEVK